MRHVISIMAVAGLIGLAAVTAFAQTQTFTPRDESPEEFAAGPGRDETFYTCTACHNFKLVAQQGLSRERWDEIITMMNDKHGMPLPDAKEREALLNYLEVAYPPTAPAAGGWQNPFSNR